MFRSLGFAATLAALYSHATACGQDACYGPIDTVEHVRHVKRMQPGVPDAAYGPKAPLQWGQVNFLHTVRRPVPFHVPLMAQATAADSFLARPIPMDGSRVI